MATTREEMERLYATQMSLVVFCFTILALRIMSACLCASERQGVRQIREDLADDTFVVFEEDVGDRAGGREGQRRYYYTRRRNTLDARRRDAQRRRVLHKIRRHRMDEFAVITGRGCDDDESMCRECAICLCDLYHVTEAEAETRERRVCVRCVQGGSSLDAETEGGGHDDAASSHLTLLPCGHIFHERCIAEWFVHKRASECPLCKRRAFAPTPIAASPPPPHTAATSENTEDSDEEQQHREEGVRVRDDDDDVRNVIIAASFSHLFLHHTSIPS